MFKSAAYFIEIKILYTKLIDIRNKINFDTTFVDFYFPLREVFHGKNSN